MVPTTELYLIAASRFSAWATLTLVAFVLLRILYERWPISLADPVDRIILGSAIEAISWAVHQCYWWGASMSKITTGQSVWFSENSHWSTLCYVGILAGAGLLISPVTEKLLGGKWVFVSGLTVASLWCAGLAVALGG